MTKPLVSFTNISKQFPVRQGGLSLRWLWGKTAQHVHALHQVSLNIFAGETLCLVGETGCGKSTLARVLMGLTSPNEGEVRYQNQRIDHLNDDARMAYRQKMQMVFQNPYASLNPRMTVYQTLKEAIELHKKGLSQSDVQNEVNGLLDSVGLPVDAQDRFPHEFSGGQRQRIALARALSVGPELIVADEPLSALDVSVQAQVLNLMMDKQAEHGLTYLFITHDLAVVEHIATRVVVMYLGTICEIGSRESLFARPKHPYTKALIASMPRLDHLELNAQMLSGEVPTPLNRPSGCAFCQRCPAANQRCYEEIPVRIVQADGSEVACHAVEEGRSWK